MGYPAQPRALVFSSSVAPAGAAQVDVDVLGCDYCWLLFRFTGTVTIGDLGLSNVKAFALDESTILADIGVFTYENADAVAASGGNIQCIRRFRVTGLSKVRVTVTNNNVAAKVLDVWAFRA